MPGTFVIYTDGASRGNPGLASIGAVVYAEEEGDLVEVATVSEPIGVDTNNVAEYKAVIEGLKAVAAFDPDRVTLRADSQLLIRQLKGEYRVKAANLKPLFIEAKRLVGSLGRVKLEHVPREQNKVADGLANAALDG